MTDVFREIDEEVRAEQVRLAVRRYGWLVGLVAVLVLVGVGSWQAIAYRDRQAQARLSAAYLHATRQADDLATNGFGGTSPQLTAARDAAIASFAPLEGSGDAGIRTLARLRAAQLLSDRGDTAGAVRLLDAVAGDGAAEPAMRDLATLFSVERQLATGRPDVLHKRLDGIEEPGGAFRALAFEAQAAIDLARGQVADARREIELVLTDGAAPQGARERAATLLQAIGLQAPGTQDQGTQNQRALGKPG